MHRRAADVVSQGLSSRVCVLTASAGWGKTTVARAALEGREHCWIDLASAADEPGALFTELHRALEMPGTAELPLEDFVAALPACGIVAIDDLHRIERDPASLELVRAIVERRADLHLLLISRHALPLPTATWAANGVATIPIAEAELALAPDDIRTELERWNLRADAATVAAIARATQGWAVAVRFALLALQRSSDLSRVESISRDLAFKYLAEQVVSGLDASRRDVLGDLALAGAFDEALLARLGYDDGGEIAHWIATAGLPLHRSPGVARLHDVFAAFLVAQMSAAERARHADRVAAALIDAEKTGEALDVLRFHATPERLTEFLERHGLTLLQLGRRSSVKGAIDRLPARTRRDNPVILMLRASIERGAGNASLAEALSDRAIETADRDATFFADLLRTRAILKLYESRPDAMEWMERVVRRASPEVRDALRGPYAIGLAVGGEAAKAVAEIDAVIADAERSGDPYALARAYTWALTVFVHVGDRERLAASAARALDLHERNADARGVAIAYNTLAGAALILEDDRELALRYGRAYHEAAKAWDDPANIRQSAALLYQLAVEAGGPENALDPAARPDDTDASFIGLLWFRLARATHEAWSGDFASGARLLETLDGRIADPAERSCWHAATAFFRALCGDTAAAAAHLAAVERGSGGAGPVGRKLERLAHAYAAFAEIVLGNPTAARKRLPAAERNDERALCEAAERLSFVGLSAGAAALEPIAARLEERGQTGFARLLRAAARAAAPSQRDFGLTQAELRVLRSLAAGMPPKLIAAESGRSVETIRNQVKAAIRKTGASGRLEAVALARSAGLL